jgi:Ca2+-binding RTX toxin-like protein
LSGSSIGVVTLTSNLSDFITVVAEGANTKLTIDHDGTGALNNLVTITLKNIAYRVDLLTDIIYTKCSVFNSFTKIKCDCVSYSIYATTAYDCQGWTASLKHTIKGNNAANILTTTSTKTTLHGLGGNDTLTGDTTDDILVGGYDQ